MLPGEKPVGSRPVNVALLMLVSLVNTKSSADSISFDGAGETAVSGRDAVAIRPSGLPVLKKNGSAAAGIAVSRPSRAAAPEVFAISACTGFIGFDAQFPRRSSRQDGEWIGIW